jgi:hypothetical protein
MKPMEWEFAKVWNDSLLKEHSRPIEPRDYIWASEIGGAYADRYLRMTGIAPTNPPNNRSLRKFQAGNIWEFVIQFVLTRAGILISRQQHLKFQYDGLLAVTGRPDFMVGGVPNIDKAKEDIMAMGLPGMMHSASMAIVEKLEGMHKVELKEIFLEIKSSSELMWPKYEIGGADARHKAQIFHYLKSTGMDEGHVVYINKDNCLLLEYPVYNPGPDEKFYKDDIEAMTQIYKEGKYPKEEDVIFEPVTCRFRTNWKVEYSNYLTMLYGHESPENYRFKYKKLVDGMNRVMKRCINGDKMTKANLEIISDAKRLFPNWDEIVDMAKVTNVNIEEETEEQE